MKVNGVNLYHLNYGKINTKAVEKNIKEVSNLPREILNQTIELQNKLLRVNLIGNLTSSKIDRYA